jgi:hypothetical protein
VNKLGETGNDKKATSKREFRIFKFSFLFLINALTWCLSIMVSN